MAVRAKFRLTSIQQHANMAGKTYRFQPQYDTSIPEDQRYSKYTPSGELQLYVDNPAVEEQWPIGSDFYLDFTPAEAN
jgi:hypothetical protein